MSQSRRVEAIAEATGDDEDAILRKGLESYIERELREVRIRVNEIKAAYDVQTRSELESRLEDVKTEPYPNIRRGSVS